MAKLDFWNHLGRGSLMAALFAILQPSLPAAPVPVRHLEGTLHGFLALRAPDGKLLAIGDLTQTVRGGLVTDHLVFHYNDGSLDDETTVFSQRSSFRLVRDHHIQKGPFFPRAIDATIDARSGTVTVHSTDKDGKEQVTTQHLTLPPDLVSGPILGTILQNVSPKTPETDVAMIVTTPKARVVKLIMTPHGEDPLTLEGTQRKAEHYSLKIDIGGMAGKIAPLVGKQPPDIQIWIIEGEAPTFIRSQSQLFEDGPVVTVEQIVPTWPK